MPKQKTIFTEELPDGKTKEWEVIHSFNCTYPIKKGTKCYVCKNGKEYTLIIEHTKK